MLSSAGRMLVCKATLGIIPILAFAGVLAASNLAKISADGDQTVVTMAREGSSGVVTANSTGPAIAAAIRDCRAMAGAPSDCRAQFAATPNGWVLGILCGDQKILATANNRREAEAAAGRREAELRWHYVPDLQPCRHVLTV